MAALLRSGGTTAVLALFALAALLRLAVPAGWMPAAGSGFSITICTGTGPVQVRAATRDGHGTPAGHDRDDSGCPFAALGAALAAPLVPLGAFPIVVAPVAGVVAAAVVAVGRGLAAPPPPATGPPLPV